MFFKMLQNSISTSLPVADYILRDKSLFARINCRGVETGECFPDSESLLTLHLAAKLKLRRAKFPFSPPAVWGGGRIQSGALETPLLKTL